MELEVGMYVRTKHNGIGKIIDYINDPTHYFFKCYKLDKDYINYEEYITEADVIGKPSFNIIDLIKSGDYVNGYYVSKIWEKDEITHYVNETPIKREERKIVIQAPSYGGIEILKNKNIKSVVTKEQFKQMSYELEEMK